MLKLFEKLIIDYLIPAVIYLFTLLLLFDLFSGNHFDLININHFKLLSEYTLLFLFGLILSYIMNTSVGLVIAGKIFRKINHRKREYLVCKIFLKEKKKYSEFKKEYKAREDEIIEELNNILKIKNKTTIISFYYYITNKLILVENNENIRARYYYNTNHLRVTYCTFFPFLILSIISPFLLNQWGISIVFGCISSFIFALFIVFQIYNLIDRDQLRTSTLINCYRLKNNII